jgi:HipA-like protein
MITTLKSFFKNKKEKSDKNYVVEHESTIHQFILKYQKEIVGSLRFENNRWFFEYSNWFINQKELQPLLEFPFFEKKYESEELWPFFSNRIPSIKQPKVKKYIENHSSDQNSEVKLLEIFGKNSINNPFELEAQ